MNDIIISNSATNTINTITATTNKITTIMNDEILVKLYWNSCNFRWNSGDVSLAAASISDFAPSERATESPLE